MVRLTSEGNFLRAWTTERLDLRGLTFVSDVLYLADADTESVYKAVVPKPVTKATQTPIDLATDGTSLYLVADGTPYDRVLVVNPADGSVSKDFNAPGHMTGAMTYMGDALYIADNQWPPTIHEVSKEDGTVLNSFAAPNSWEVGGMAPDDSGAMLVVGARWENTVFTMDPANPTAYSQDWVDQANFPFFWGFQAMAQGSLYAVSGNAFLRIDSKPNGMRVTDFRELGFD